MAELSLNTHEAPSRNYPSEADIAPLREGSSMVPGTLDAEHISASSHEASLSNPSRHTGEFNPPQYMSNIQVATPSSLDISDTSAHGTTLPDKPHFAITNSMDTTVSSPLHQTHWDTVVVKFLREAGLTQALRGFESDMIVMSPDWERDKVPGALKRLVEGLTGSAIPKFEEEAGINDIKAESSLDERKLEYTHFAPGVEPRTPSTITKSISRFLAQNRARNDASNRQEFLLSMSEKRRKLNENGDYEGVVASCARTDAKTQNRDLQMKFDIAKNEDGPLRKTVSANVKTEETTSDKASGVGQGRREKGIKEEEEPTAGRYPGLDERLKSIEEHIAVRYVPSPPRSLLDRLKFIEDHLVHLETEYPPWAALHFNQPRRGWPPPPRPTPIIVPSHLTSSAPHPQSTSTPIADNSAVSMSPSESIPGTPAGLSAKAKGKQAARRDQSSLHRAVMERLEVQKAMEDLAGKQ